MLHARHAFREFEPERHRILAEILGDVVDEALDREGVVAVADAAPRRQPRAAVLDDVLGELVGNRILRDRRALHHDAVLPRFWIAGDVSHDGFGNDAVMPGDELAVGVEAGLDVVRRHRAEFAEGDVVLARPDQLHRLADRLGETNRVVHGLVVAAPAETAAEEMLVQRDLGALGLQDAGDAVEEAGCRLGADPKLGRFAVGADGGGRVHRLHLRVIDVARAIFAAEHALGARHRRLGVALVLVRHAVAVLVAADRREILERLLAVEMRARRIAPGHLEQVLGGLRCFDGRADDADAFRQLHDVGDARHFTRARVVDVLRRAARIGRLQHRGVDHARHLHIHAVFGSAFDFQRHVDARDILADEPEACRRLEIAFVDLRQFGGRGRESGDLAIADAPARGLVHDDARFGRKLADRHRPFCRDRIEQDAARLRAGDAQRREVAGHRSARRRLEGVIVSRIAEFLVVPLRREHRPDLAPVGVELFGDDDRQGGERALAHLGRRRDHGDDAVGRDRQPDIRRVRRRRVGEGVVDEGERIGRDRQRQAEPGRGFEEIAAVHDLAVLIHGSALPRRALDGADDLQIGAAAADIAVHVLDDVVARRVLVGREQRRRLHDLAGLAVAALRHLLGDPGLLQRMAAVGRQSLDGGHGLSRDQRQRHRARAHRLAVDMHRAGAAGGDAAAEFGAGEFEMLAQHPKQRRVGRGIDLVPLSVDGQGDHRTSPWA